MKNSGVAIMGMGKASGESRATKAIENALASPLLNSNDITGASSILINISSGSGEHEITMDELGEITDYMYEVASDDALIIRGLSKDENLNEEISVTVIATGFESNSIFQPYKRKELKQKVELFPNTGTIPKGIIPEIARDVFSVHERGKKSVINDFEDESQGIIDFSLERNEHLNEIRKHKVSDEDEEGEKPETTLKKVKHMQKLLQKEGLSNKTMKENIDTFEDVPAYVRRNMSLGTGGSAGESKLSKFTLTSGDDDEPVLRNSLEVALKVSGYDVITAESGEEGLDLFQKESPDLILLDHWLPGMNGDEVLRLIREGILPAMQLMPSAPWEWVSF